MLRVESSFSYLKNFSVSGVTGTYVMCSVGEIKVLNNFDTKILIQVSVKQASGVDSFCFWNNSSETS